MTFGAPNCPEMETMDEQDRCTMCGKVLTMSDVAYLILVDPMGGQCMKCLKHDQTLGAYE